MDRTLRTRVADLTRPARNTAIYTSSLALDLLDAVTFRRRPLVPPRRLITIGSGDFVKVGRTIVSHLIRFADLTPKARVFDIGCGCGRLAAALTNYLGPDARYEGLDIHRPYVDWCDRHITPRFPQFHFQVHDVYNKQYNPTGRLKSTEFAFPFPDASFDVVVLTSVFTHMLPRDVEHYLREISRVLVPGGRCLATFFVLDAVSLPLVKARRSSEPLDYPFEGCLVKNPDYPEFAIGYDQDRVIQLHAQAGLNVVNPIQPGAWSGRPDFLDYQDIVVSRKG